MIDIIELRKELLKIETRLFASNSMHLAIMNEPFLTYIIKGKKTIESRFSHNKIAPYQRCDVGDIVLMKSAGKPINSYFIVANTLFYENSTEILEFLKTNYSEKICADPVFWDYRKNKQYISLLEVKDVTVLNEPIEIHKKDKRGWVSFRNNVYKRIILISGPIGSGKTWLSHKLAHLLCADRCSFSDYVKWRCANLNLELNRDNLNIVGQNAISKEIDQFVYFMLNCVAIQSSDTLIIDGLRHTQIVDVLKKQCEQVDIIFINADEKLIQKNLLLRGMSQYDTKAYLMEENLCSLKEIANVVVEDNNKLKEIIDGLKLNYLYQLSIFD